MTQRKKNKILFVGGADPRKNLDFVCESLACLNNPNCSFSFDVVGNYPLSKQKDIHKEFSSIAGRIKHNVTDRQLSQAIRINNCRFSGPYFYAEIRVFQFTESLAN